MNAVATIGWIGEKGEGQFHWDGYCHAQLTSGDWYIARLESKKLISVFSGIQKNKTDVKDDHPEMERTFTEWLLFHSPFKEGLLKDEAASALEHRVLMGDVDKPSNLMGAALMSTRIFNEHPHSLRMWWEFVKRGLHPSIAFAFAHKMYVDDKGYVNEYVPSHTGCFNGYLKSNMTTSVTPESYLLNFLRGSYDNLAKPYRESPIGATSSFKLWHHKNTDEKGMPLVSEVSVLLKKAAGTAGPSKNPFGKALARPVGAMPKLEAAMDAILPYLHKYKELF
jgi:hypothetical protein